MGRLVIGRVALLVFVSLLFSACQLAPTRVYQTANVDTALLLKNLERPLVLDQKTIVVDARSPFEYAVSHVPGAINLQWQDFAQARGPYIGKVTEDLSRAVQRLALLGVGPDSRVLVVGRGKKGKGEEGRLAWTLLYLGVKNVQVADIDFFRSGLTNAEPKPMANASAWTPNPARDLDVQREEILSVATVRFKEGARPTAHLIDVRSRAEYFQKAGLGEGYVFPELRAVHIPWTQFFDGDGRPNLAMRRQLQSIGMALNDRIVVISNQGLRSGAVTFALQSMGFAGAGNYSGGYQELMAKAP